MEMGTSRLFYLTPRVVFSTDMYVEKIGRLHNNHKNHKFHNNRHIFHAQNIYASLKIKYEDMSAFLTTLGRDLISTIFTCDAVGINVSDTEFQSTNTYTIY